MAMVARQPRAVGDDLAVVGRTYRTRDIVVDADRARAYAEVAGDDPDRYGTAATHPCFVINPAMRVLERLLDDPDLSVQRSGMLHARSDMLFARPLVPGSRVHLRATITDAGAYGSRQAYVVDTAVLDDDERLLVHVDTILAFPTWDLRGAAGRPPLVPPPALLHAKDPLVTVERHLADDLPARYAAASGDHNPIHLDDEAARAAGLPGVILHGMSTMAVGATAAIETLCQGDPRRLRRMRVRFSKPVRPGCTGSWRFHATNRPRHFAIAASADGRSMWKQSICQVV